MLHKEAIESTAFFLEIYHDKEDNLVKILVMRSLLGNGSGNNLGMYDVVKRMSWLCTNLK